MHKEGDILHSKSRDAWYLVVAKVPYENNTFRYTLLDLQRGKHIHSFAPRGLYRKA